MNRITSAHAFYGYIACTCSYGFLRKAKQMQHATIQKYDYESHVDKIYPVLLCDKVLITLLSTCVSPYIWPFYLYNDLNYMELHNKKDRLDPKWYGYEADAKYSALYYLFN
jgi:hypothetical protein